ncbi:hypothetical protein DFH27DRAFT_520713 [Peziza echinospora]|nr:hypothetical protein DFH27DRAFT_520713 [Peziza echinospora]
MASIPADDPFTTPDVGRTGGLLYNQHRLNTSNASPNGRGVPHASPAQLKRTLQKRLEEVQRRIAEAGHLGESLLRQQQELNDRLVEVEAELVNGGEINPELRKRLADLEREYNEVHKESARALLSSKIHGGMESPHKSPHSSTFQSLGSSSPTKLSVPGSRRNRNQPQRPHDIEFAADLAQNLIAELRKLNATILERDETIKLILEEKNNLERHAAQLEARIKVLDESEQRCKERNWQLELLVQELRSQEATRDESDGKLQAQLVVVEQEKLRSLMQIEELKQKEAIARDESEITIRHHESEIGILKRTLATTEVEKETFKNRLEELSQELEEAHNTSSRLKHLNDELTAQQQQAKDPFQSSKSDDGTPEHSPPASPSKQAPRHGPLEAETLRSSLTHAHRLISQLKGTVHREKTEKAELKRMLAEARDELEQLRKEGSAPPSVKKPRRDTLSEIKYKKPPKPHLLGAGRRPKHEVLMLNDDDVENAEWEDHALDSPSPMGSGRPTTLLNRNNTSSSMDSAFETAQETDGAFETANEKSYMDEPQTPMKDYPTSADELTETEDNIGRHSVYSGMGSYSKSSLILKKRERGSIADIQSEDDDEEEDGPLKPNPYFALDPNAFEPREELSPSHTTRLKLRIRSGRGRLGHRIPSDGSMFSRARGYSLESSPNQSFPTTAAQSPAASMRPRGSISSVQVTGASKSLFAELGGSFNSELTEDDEAMESKLRSRISSGFGSPIRSGFGSPSRYMVDSGCNTEEPYPETATAAAVIVAHQETPVPKTPKPIMLESGTQSTPVRQVTFAESGTQPTPLRRSESGTQSTPLPKAVLFDSSTQFTPVRRKVYAESSAQSDETPKRPAMVPAGVQSDSTPKLPMISSGMQFEGLPNMVPIPTVPVLTRNYSSTGAQPDPVESIVTSSVGIQYNEPEKEISTASSGVQSDEIAGPEMVSSGVQSDVEEKPVTIEASTQSDEEPVKVIELISTGTQCDPEPAKFVEEVVVIAPEIKKVEMVEFGTQYDPELEQEEEVVAVVEANETDADVVVIPPPAPVEVVDTATQFDPELEFVPIILPEVSTGFTQTDPVEVILPRLSIALAEVAKQEPVEVIEPINFSGITSQDIVPVEPEHKAPRALPPIPIPVPVPGLGQNAPRKSTSSLEIPREQPFTLSDEYNEKPPTFGSVSKRGKAAISEQDLVPTAVDKGKQVDRRPVMVDQGVQTAITYESSDKGLRPVLAPAISSGPSYIPFSYSNASVVVHPPRTSSIQSMSRGVGRVPDIAPQAIKRPGSSNSNRSFTATYPPLPEDHREAIAAAQQNGAGLMEPTYAMGPPQVPASAARNIVQRPRTPLTNTIRLVEESPTSKGGSTPRPRQTHSQATMRSDVASPMSHRSSMSSFASELDDRFRMNDVRSNPPQQTQNDPRIIQAITQTMIGEFLWKYTRTTTKRDLSSNRHRRFFWIHPYTRTLYWSEQDPSTAGKHEMRAKSVSIEAVRVITDDNPLPPGLHRKSLVVVTPGRSLQFTAPTGQRHETWFLALSYLLTQRMDESGNGAAAVGTGGSGNGAVTGEEESEDQQEEVDYSTTTVYNGPRAASSMSSYNSRGTRNASPVRNASSLSHRRPPPTTNPNPGSMSRLSNMFGTFGTKSSRNTSVSTNGQSVYDNSEAVDSIEDMRLEMERQEREADRMEYVRACCDGIYPPSVMLRNMHKLNHAGSNRET